MKRLNFHSCLNVMKHLLPTEGWYQRRLIKKQGLLFLLSENQAPLCSISGGQLENINEAPHSQNVNRGQIQNMISIPMWLVWYLGKTDLNMIQSFRT